MARYATGRKAWGYSDRSGFRYRLREMRKEWNGLKVGPDEYAAKHPQLEPNYPGPDPTHCMNQDQIQNRTSDRKTIRCKSFLHSGSGAITVTEKNHGRSSSDTVRFRDALALEVKLQKRCLNHLMVI